MTDKQQLLHDLRATPMRHNILLNDIVVFVSIYGDVTEVFSFDKYGKLIGRRKYGRVQKND